MGKPFSDEVNFIPQAIAWAMEQNIELLARSIGSLSKRNLIAIGSGGSSTAAVFLTQAHELAFAQLSRSATPGEFWAQPVLLDNSAVALISAEGKNRDILAAAERVAFLEIPSFALVLNEPSPLDIQCRQSSSTTVISFPMPWKKDGYLATNSLIATMVLIARAYGFQNIEGIKALDKKWLEARRESYLSQGLAKHMARRGNLAVLYGTVGKIGGIDIESKLSEAALGFCEVTDYRQFAHGRHLQLAVADDAPCFLAFRCSRDIQLCETTLTLFPPEVPVVRQELPDSFELASIVSVIDAILITEILGEAKNQDPGQPDVTSNSRAMYHLDLRELLNPAECAPAPIRRKVGKPLLSFDQLSEWRSAGQKFCAKLAASNFKAVVCDFDGTFCNTDLRFDGMDKRLIPVLESLLRGGLIVGFATGRGDSLYHDLRAKLNHETWSRVLIGYYSGSHIAQLSCDGFTEPSPDPRFEALEEWLVAYGLVPADKLAGKKHGGQLSLRFGALDDKNRLFAGIHHWIDREDLQGWRVFRSGHSIDVLTENAGKVRVIQAVADRIGCDPQTEILKIGDSGDFDGNDFELLQGGFGLSVDNVSPSPAGCWNLLPPGYLGSLGTLYYLQAVEPIDGAFRVSSQFLEDVKISFQLGRSGS